MSDWPRTISISTAGFSPKIRRLSPQEKQRLLDSGQAGARAFLLRAQGRK